MCNTLHEKGHCAIPARGEGYKIFVEKDESKQDPLTMFYTGGREAYTQDKDGWIRWKPERNLGDGFCFFSTLTEARRYHNIAKSLRKKHCPIRKILYEEGLGKCDEKGMRRHETFHISICKAFKIGEVV